jgi:hypothetical protein
VTSSNSISDGQKGVKPALSIRPSSSPLNVGPLALSQIRETIAVIIDLP